MGMSAALGPCRGETLMNATARDRLMKKIGAFPAAPGIYLMKDRRSEVIYVGKARDLRARVRSYFLPAARDDRLISLRLDHVADVDVVVAGSEKEALILENNFIKQFRPKYNVYFKDDKSFTSIKIDLKEPWPRPIVTRNLDDRDALYFGPYASAKSARETLRVLKDIFPLRRCSIRECNERRRPCIYGEMGKCAAPCCRDVSEEDYGRLVNEVITFLKGRCDDLVAGLRQEMQRAAASQQYERAAEIRDRIAAIEKTLERQQVGSSVGTIDRDIFGLCAFDRYVWITALFVRDGNVQDVASYRFARRLDSEKAIFRSFLNQFYSANRFIPDEVLLPVESEDSELLHQWLSEKKGRKVEVICPRRGNKKRLVELANRNAREAERVATTEDEKRLQEMESLQRLLSLSELPRNVECFDVSTLTGREAVGSMVVFRDARPDKSSYRHYKIRDVGARDDTAMMREVLGRRYSRLVAEQQEPPELILLDGGRGQLGVALGVLSELGLEGPDVAALAKARSRGGEQVKAERVFLPGRSEAIELPEGSFGFRFITRIRDEAHRFAISYHRKLRRKAVTESPLTEIEGIGEKLARRLMEHFGGLNKIRAASIEQLQQVKGISERLARAVHQHLHRNEV